METKKSKKADLEWRKPVFFQLGIFLTMGLVLILFELTGAREKENVSFDLKGDSVDPDIVINTTTPEKPIPKQLPPPLTIFKTTENNNPIDNSLFDAETDGNESVEASKILPVAPDIEPDIDDKIYDVSEVDPEFPGGLNAMNKFISENVVYPKIAIEIGLEGTVMVGFIVDKNGNIANVNVLKGKAPVLDIEAMRVVCAMPKWSPGKQCGRNVNVKYRIPIVFKLN